MLDALTDATATSGTIAEQEARLAELYGTTTASARDVTSFLRENKENLIRLSSSGRPTLELLAQYADAFPCTLRTVAGFVPAMDKALGKGTNEARTACDGQVRSLAGEVRPRQGHPGLQRDRRTALLLGAVRRQGCPHRRQPPVGRCHRPTPAARDSALGLPNSPQESRLVNELVAPR